MAGIIKVDQAPIELPFDEPDSRSNGSLDDMHCASMFFAHRQRSHLKKNSIIAMPTHPIIGTRSSMERN